MCVCVCLHVCLCVCMRVCWCMCVRVPVPTFLVPGGALSMQPSRILCLNQLHWFNLQTATEPLGHIKSMLLGTGSAGFSAFNT